MILITGATGHIGNVLVHALARRHPHETLRIFLQHHEHLDHFDRLKLELYYGDIRRLPDVQAAVSGARVVFHLAGLIDTSLRPGPILRDINVGGTKNVVIACENTPGVRLIYVSSVHALPDLPGDATISEVEDFPVLGLLGGYAQSKSDATALVTAAVKRGLDAVIAFPSGVIGPDDYKLSEMGRMFRYFHAIGSLRLVLSFRGAYNFVDVRDVVSGLLAMAEHGRTGQGYILSGHRISLAEIIRLEREVVGFRQPLILSVPVSLVKAGAYLMAGFAHIFHIHSIITPYSIAVLQSNSFISHEKASRELGYLPRPIVDTFRDSLTWMLQAGLIKKMVHAR
ncbi:MAG: NAD-dependent epimerase/dehydratase family protein [Eubacteriales bacterium]|nr:NAD-dependent epimerase/dehydratase family protein [Eubacteriales bacterium]